MGQRLPALLAVALVLVGCGRLSFDPLARDGAVDGEVDAALPPELWTVTLGGGALETGLASVVELPTGDLLLAGASQLWGSNLRDGWVARLDSHTGALESGGTRNFDVGTQTWIHRARLVGDRLLVAGADYESNAEQQTFGELDLDGNWISAWRASGGLVHPGEYEGFLDFISLADGSVIAAGVSRIGNGGCGSCLGTDALLVKLAADRSVVWAQVFGSSFGDESFRRVLELPDGSLVAFGGGFGRHDYSAGAGADEDLARAFVVRVDSSGGNPQTRQLRLPVERGGVLRDGFYDAVAGELVLVGAMGSEDVPLLVHLRPDLTVVRAREVVIADRPGLVTDVIPAEDGGLFIAGFEYENAVMRTTREIFVARLAPSRETVVWAARAILSRADYDTVGLLRSRYGDLIVWGTGASGTGKDAIVMRMNADTGAGPPCSRFQPVTMTLRTITDNSALVGATTVGVAGASTIASPTSSMTFPTSPAPATRCLE